MKTFKRGDKLTHIRYVSQSEISRLVGLGSHTISSLENLTGSNSTRIKLARMVKRNEGITRVKSSILGHNNQYVYVTEGSKVNYEGLIENIGTSLGVFFLRESLKMKLSKAIPIRDAESYAVLRSFLSFGKEEGGRSYYMDLRFSYFDEKLLQIEKFKTKDDKSTNVIVFPDAVLFGTFRNQIKNDDEVKNQVWIILNGTNAMISGKGTEAKIIANLQPINSRDEFIAAFNTSENVQSTSGDFHSIVQGEYDKAERNSKRFLQAMEEGKMRAKEKAEE